MAVTASTVALALCLLSAVAAAASAAQQPVVVDIPRACPQLRIAVINGVPFHYEVLSGLLHVLRPYEDQLDVFLNPYVRSGNADGAWDFLKWSRAHFYKTTMNLARIKHTYDVAVLVSPDYELDANHDMLLTLKPRLTVAIVHNSDLKGLGRLLNISQTVKLITLAPHVANSLAANTGHSVDWVLATYPFKPKTDCLTVSDVDLLGGCLRGFAMQGKFSNQRRNYTAIWQQVQQRKQQLEEPRVAPLFHLNILGKGPNRLNLPADLEPHVTLHRRLHYKRFYEVIHHNFALIPALASQKYYTEKFSSTIITSFITGTPMIVSKAFLGAYTMFDERSVYLQRDDEHEVDTMIRIMKTPAKDVLSARTALLRLQEELNQRAAEYYGRAISQACTGDPG